MVGYYEFKTRVGAFSIIPNGNRWNAKFADEALGNYASAEQALGDLEGGHTDWPSCGDPSRFGLPDELSEWTFIRLR